MNVAKILISNSCKSFAVGEWDRGLQLATASGDTTVKIWDFANAMCIQTFADHQKAGTYTFNCFSITLHDIGQVINFVCIFMHARCKLRQSHIFDASYIRVIFHSAVFLFDSQNSQILLDN